MAKRIILGLMVLVAAVGVSWGAVTLDDIAKAISEVKVELAGIQSDIGWIRIIMTTLFTSLFAAIAGLFYFVFDISRSWRTPKEERVSRLEALAEKIKDHLREIDEKLHLPKSVLIISLALILLFSSTGWGAPLTAPIPLLGDTFISGSLGVGTNEAGYRLNVKDDANVKGMVTVGGALNVGNDTTLRRNATVQGNLNVSGSLTTGTVGGDLNVTGRIAAGNPDSGFKVKIVSWTALSSPPPPSTISLPPNADLLGIFGATKSYAAATDNWTPFSGGSGAPFTISYRRNLGIIDLNPSASSSLDQFNVNLIIFYR